MNKRLLLCTGFFIIQLFGFTNKTYFSGSIAFPKVLKNIPNIRIYCGGNTLTCTYKDNTIHFEFQESSYRTHFYLVITPPSYFFEMIESNVVNYQKIRSGQPYKFYEVTQDREQKKWSVKQLVIPSDTGRIPDQAIIICYDPEYIDTLKGGDSLQLPTIYIKDDILDLAGSEEKLHEQSIKYVLASLRLDPFHATAQTIENRTLKKRTRKT